ncbi:hypothetical protein QBC37DRAFT_23498 [Rhypophila decipiens]|uniref:Peptidase S8/S53 domain-containing protein n=1 Tax=Rhypophila decipiens TaxID=261697 RepID=A0AAN6Y6A3_9PEZI|nr:hypothetical protein QBC37DRAFT_23498 [Rhypophila decipiens]
MLTVSRPPESAQPSTELSDAFVVSTSVWTSVVLETSVVLKTSVWTSIVLETITQTSVGSLPVIYTVTGDSTTTSTIGTPTTVGLSSEAPSTLSTGTPSTSSIQGQTTIASSSTQGSTPTSLSSPPPTTSPVGISSASSTSTSEASLASSTPLSETPTAVSWTSQPLPPSSQSLSTSLDSSFTQASTSLSTSPITAPSSGAPSSSPVLNPSPTPWSITGPSSGSPSSSPVLSPSPTPWSITGPSSGSPSSSPVLSPSPSTWSITGPSSGSPPSAPSQISTTPSTSLVESSLPASLPTPTAAPASVTVPVPSGFTLSWTSFPTPFTLSSIPELPSAVPTWPAGTSSSSSTTSSSATPSPTANASPQYIAPLHVFKLDNVAYFMNPYCDEEPQVLWLSDGTNFTLHCDRFELFNGTVLAMPATIADDVDCSGLGLALDDICCLRRFNWVKTGEPTSNSTAEWCNADITPHSMFKTAARDSTTAADDPISQIASKLGGLPNFACEVSQAMLSLAVSIFSMGMATDNFMSAADDVIELFIATVTRQSDALLAQLNTWVHDVDQTMLELYCIVDTADGHKSRIWRVLTHQHHLHVGMNVLLSVNRAGHVNWLVKVIISVLRLIIRGIALRFKFLIGAWGAVLEGMGQLSRTCNTNWKEPALRNPQDEEPEEEDEDGMTIRFWIEGSQLSSLAQLWTVEGTLGVPIGGVPDDNPQGPWEISAASRDGSVPPSLLIDLSPMQALMAKAALTGTMTMAKLPGWDQFLSVSRDIPDTRGDPRPLRSGSDGKTAQVRPQPEVDHDILDRNKTSEEDKHGDNELAAAADPDPPPEKTYPWIPLIDRVEFTNPSDQRPFISRPKGKDEKWGFYSHHSSDGQGSWIFIIDTGFTTAQYEKRGQVWGDTGREIRKRVVPRHYLLPKLAIPRYQPATPGNPAPVPQQKIWPVPDSIEDDCWDDDRMFQQGHGMMMTSIAAGKTFGVAPKANLYLIKAMSGVYYKDPATVPPGVNKPVGLAMVTRLAFEKIMNKIFLEVTRGGIPPAKSFIVIAIQLGSYRTRPLPAGGWETDQEWRDTWNEWRNKLDALGVTFVFASSNAGFEPRTGGPKYYQEDLAVAGWIGQDSPAILVGGVYPDGSLWEGTTPSDPRRNGAQISIYGRAWDQSAFVAGSASDRIDVRHDLAGCSGAAAQVAGLVAYFLAYPWPAGTNPFDPTDTSKTVGKRMKEYLISASYRRVPDIFAIIGYALRQGGEIEHAGFDEFPYYPPSWINTAYNLAEGPQRCLAVGSLPAGRFGAAADGGYPDTCPVPAVVPGNDATWTGTALTAASTYSAPDLPTTLSWTITSESTTFVSVVTWAPSSTSTSATRPRHTQTRAQVRLLL